jgi:cytochrome P450
MKASPERSEKIKKGVTLMANAWAIGRDEKVFDPALGGTQDFVPEPVRPTGN